jgi:hypothetical protein
MALRRRYRLIVTGPYGRRTGVDAGSRVEADTLARLLSGRALAEVVAVDVPGLDATIAKIEHDLGLPLVECRLSPTTRHDFKGPSAGCQHCGARPKA